MECGLLIMNSVGKNIIWVLSSIRYNRKAAIRWGVTQGIGVLGPPILSSSF